MSDKTDLRLESAKGWVAEDWERELREDDIPFPDDSLTERAVDMLADLDDADRAAGVVRVDTNDEALVERLLTALTDEGFETPMGFARVDDYVTAPSYTAEHANQVRELVAADEESSRLNREAVRRAVLAALREES